MPESSGCLEKARGVLWDNRHLKLNSSRIKEDLPHRHIPHYLHQSQEPPVAQMERIGYPGVIVSSD